MDQTFLQSHRGRFEMKENKTKITRTVFRPRFVNAHINLKLIMQHHYVKIPRLIRDMMDLCSSEPLLLKYDDKTKKLTIQKEKGVAGGW